MDKCIKIVYLKKVYFEDFILRNGEKLINFNYIVYLYYEKKLILGKIVFGWNMWLLDLKM